jgi:uncharacterized protein YraI
MTRFKTISLACGMLLFAAVSASAAPALVTADVKMRSGPANSSGVVATLRAGTVVNVFDCEDVWCRVSWGRKIGYAGRRFLGLGPPPVYTDITSPLLYSWHRGWRHRYWHHQWYSER